MALEVAPAPAKTTPAKSSAKTAPSRNESMDQAAKPSGHSKGSDAQNPAGFLALLMGLGQDPVSDGVADPTLQVTDTAEESPSESQMPLTAVIPDAGVAAPVPAIAMSTSDTTTLPGVAPPEPNRLLDRSDDKMRAPVDASILAVSDSSAGVRNRGLSQAGKADPSRTQQLQTEPFKEASAKTAELAVAREAKFLAPPGRPEAPLFQMPASLQVPLASEETRKGSFLGQAKAEVVDNLVLLSSGLSGAMSATGIANIESPDSAGQFQSVVAQEVAYYVSHDVQSAEMKLEGVGGGPVEVSINLQGQEAQVVFRTDELQTREMLEGATAQLKDMLEQQGVLLTGVFVGGSDAGAAGQQQDRKFRQGPRSETTVRVASPEALGSRVSATGVGRTLDLYV